MFFMQTLARRSLRKAVKELGIADKLPGVIKAIDSGNFNENNRDACVIGLAGGGTASGYFDLRGRAGKSALHQYFFEYWMIQTPMSRGDLRAKVKKWLQEIIAEGEAAKPA